MGIESERERSLPSGRPVKPKSIRDVGNSRTVIPTATQLSVNRPETNLDAEPEVTVAGLGIERVKVSVAFS